MRILHCKNILLILGLSFFLTTPIDAEENEARILLNKAYQQNDIPQELVRILGSCNVSDDQQAILAFSRCRNPKERAEITQLLVDLFALSKEDERSGRIKPVKTPYFNVPYQYPAVEFRTHLLETLGSFIAVKESQEMILPSIEWVCENDQSVENRGLALTLLNQIKGEQANQLILKLLKPGEESSKILLTAINLVGSRQLKEAITTLQKLIGHPRPSIRQASINALGALGIEAQVAQKQKMPDKLHTSLLHLFEIGLYKPSKNIQRVLIHQKGDEKSFPWYAWQLSSEDNSIEILNNDGSIQKWSKKDDHLESFDESYGYLVKLEQGKVIESSLEEEMKELIDQINLGKFRDSYRGLPPQPLYGMAYPVFVAAWALNQGEESQTNELLQTVLNAYFDKDETAFKVAEYELAWEAYRDGADTYQKGDLQKAQALLQRVVDHFPEYENYKIAQDLAKQLTEDMKNPPLALPTYVEWNEQAKKLNIEEQAQTLVSFFSRIKSDRAWFKDPVPEDQSQVINPTALVYQLGLDAIPALTQGLKNGRYLPLVSSSMHLQDPVRYVSHVCDLSASILNELIHFNDVIGCLADKSEKEQVAQVNRILTWYEENNSLSEAQRLLKIVKEGKTWYEVDHNAWRLVELNAKEAVPIFLKFLELPSNNEFNRSDILRCLWKLKASEALPQAQKLLNDSHPQVSIYAGMIAYLYGDKEQGLQIIEQGLINGNSSTVSPYTATDAVTVLLESKGDKEFQISRQVFGRDYFTKGFSTDVQQLLEVFKKYRPQELNSILVEQLNDCREFEGTWDANGNKIRQCDLWARFLSERNMKPSGFSFNQLTSLEEKDRAITELKEYFQKKN